MPSFAGIIALRRIDRVDGSIIYSFLYKESIEAE